MLRGRAAGPGPPAAAASALRRRVRTVKGGVWGLIGLGITAGYLAALAALLFLLMAFLTEPLRLNPNMETAWILKIVDTEAPPPQQQQHKHGGKRHKVPKAALENPWGLRYAHMGMLGALPNGSMVSFFQGSVEPIEGTASQSLYWSTSHDEGKTWEAPSLFHRGGIPLWAPVFHAEAGRVWIFFATSNPNCRYYDKNKHAVRFSPGGDIVYMISDDSGGSWKGPHSVLKYESGAGIPKVIANKLTTTANGDWVLPFWREPGQTCPIHKHETEPAKWVNGSAGVLVSPNQGLSWKAHGNLTNPDTWLLENTAVHLGNGELLQLFRSGAGAIFSSRSYDNGATWSTPVPTALPNPNSKIHMEIAREGCIVLVYNHSEVSRNPLTVAISKDNGHHWSPVTHLEDEPTLQFAYPTLQVHGKNLLVIYTVMKKRAAMGTRPSLLMSVGIKVAKLPLSDIC